MREWIFENGIEVYEMDFDHDLHMFRVYDGDIKLGYIYPACLEDFENCVKLLDSGEDPVTGGWEDGCGNPCSRGGWNN